MTLALADGTQKRYPNDGAFVLIGADPPVAVAREDGHPLRRAPAPVPDGQDRRHRAPLRRARDRVPGGCRARGGADARRLDRHRAVDARAAPHVRGAAACRWASRCQGPRKWLRSATSIFSTAARSPASHAAQRAADRRREPATPASASKKFDAPVPLSEFAKRGKRELESPHAHRPRSPRSAVRRRAHAHPAHAARRGRPHGRRGLAGLHRRARRRRADYDFDFDDDSPAPAAASPSMRAPTCRRSPRSSSGSRRRSRAEAPERRAAAAPPSAAMRAAAAASAARRCHARAAAAAPACRRRAAGADAVLRRADAPVTAMPSLARAGAANASRARAASPTRRVRRPADAGSREVDARAADDAPSIDEPRARSTSDAAATASIARRRAEPPRSTLGLDDDFDDADAAWRASSAARRRDRAAHQPRRAQARRPATTSARARSTSATIRASSRHRLGHRLELAAWATVGPTAGRPPTRDAGSVRAGEHATRVGARDRPREPEPRRATIRVASRSSSATGSASSSGAAAWAASSRRSTRSSAARSRSRRCCRADRRCVDRRFEREVQITARLEHPSIVPLYDAGTMPDGRPFYVMRRVTGRPLDELIGARATSTSGSRCCRTCSRRSTRSRTRTARRHPSRSQAGEHPRRRDRRDRRDRLGPREGDRRGGSRRRRRGDHPDRGGLAADAARRGVRHARASWRPSRRAARSSDRAATSTRSARRCISCSPGEPPIAGKSATEVIASTIQRKIAPVAEAAPSAPAELVAIVDKALAFEPQDRYANAGGARRGRAAVPRPASSSRRTATRGGSVIARFAKRHRAPLSVAALATVAVAVLAWIGVHRILVERDSANSARADAETERSAGAEGQRRARRARRSVADHAGARADSTPTRPSRSRC